MAHYHIGRIAIGNFEILSADANSRLTCSIFQKWIEELSDCCYCGMQSSAKLSKTVEFSTKNSSSMEGSIESSLGFSGLVQLKSKIQGVIGREVSWSRSKGIEVDFPIEAPKCGQAELTIYQMIREYEISYFVKGGYLFRRDVWDHRWSKNLTEETDNYSALPDCTEWDERCKCEPVLSPQYDGRLSVDFGQLNLLIPYQLSQTSLKVRIANKVVTYPILSGAAVSSYLEASTELLYGAPLNFRSDFLPDSLMTLGGLIETSFDGDARYFLNGGVEPPRRPVTQVDLPTNRTSVLPSSMIDVNPTRKHKS